ncbi:EAL domain-containing protein [Plesiomonas shigelloides]|uniref:EAL domain-containing protein n=1 Tax=Plesiomonas shigelloides TaxID=703 RepID=UPI001785641A|nr:EAL domain-containing protein [Plesiomonas shigelloides]QOH80407.1 EAL domain-containing protein [Plesiomonas shigelloides]
MLNNVLFKYKYREMEFGVIAQPIIENRTKKVSSFELLSRSIAIDCVDSFFGTLSASDVTKVSCIQMNQIADLLSVSNKGDNLRVHVNIHYKTLFNSNFIKLAKKIKWVKFAFEINGFECDAEQLIKLKNAFKIIQSFGHEIWLDDHGVNNATVSLLLDLPWDGVKIDKEIVWRSSQEQLCALVHCCKCYAGKVTLEGVEDEYLQDLSVYAGSDFSQGFNWRLLNKGFFMQESPLLLEA